MELELTNIPLTENKILYILHTPWK